MRLENHVSVIDNPNVKRIKFVENNKRATNTLFISTKKTNKIQCNLEKKDNNNSHLLCIDIPMLSTYKNLLIQDRQIHR